MPPFFNDPFMPQSQSSILNILPEIRAEIFESYFNREPMKLGCCCKTGSSPLVSTTNNVLLVCRQFLEEARPLQAAFCTLSLHRTDSLTRARHSYDKDFLRKFRFIFTMVKSFNPHAAELDLNMFPNLKKITIEGVCGIRCAWKTFEEFENPASDDTIWRFIRNGLGPTEYENHHHHDQHGNPDKMTYELLPQLKLIERPDIIIHLIQPFTDWKAQKDEEAFLKFVSFPYP